jgi:hypothetical protein
MHKGIIKCDHGISTQEKWTLLTCWDFNQIYFIPIPRYVIF